MKYRKKPILVEAIKWDGTTSLAKHIENSLGAKTTRRLSCEQDDSCPMWYLETLTGEQRVTSGDYVIKGLKGECYPCGSDIFEMSYEPGEIQ